MTDEFISMFDRIEIIKSHFSETDASFWPHKMIQPLQTDEQYKLTHVWSMIVA